MHKLFVTFIALMLAFSAMGQNTYTEYDQIVAMLKQKKQLTTDDYKKVADFYTTLKYADLNESLGHELYIHFKKNVAANKQMIAICANGGEKNLVKLVELMDVDLVSDNYTYEMLVADFPMFANNKTVQKRFFEVIDNE